MIRVATYNIGDGPTSAKVTDLTKIALLADVIGLQEASDRGNAIDDFLDVAPEWAVWSGDGRPGARAVPILYRKRLGKVTGRYSETAVGPTVLGAPGAGPNVAKPKVINRIRMNVPGVGKVHFANSHMIPSAERHNLANASKREAHYRKHAAAVARMARRRSGVVFYTADDNAPDTSPMLRDLREVPMSQDVNAATHGIRKIDHIWHRDARKVKARVVSSKVLRNLSSDHAAAIVGYELSKENIVPRGFAPFATIKNIPPGSNDPAIVPRVAILHVDAGNSSSLFDFFKNRSGGIESHFHIKKDGEIEQYRSIFFQADANLDANDFAVSIETQGLGAGEWTPAQLASIKRLLLWLNKVADIPLVKCPKWDGSGVGYHTLFGSPSHWTPVAKLCPGLERIVQFNEDIVPWMRSLVPANTRVARARVLIDDAMDLLEATPDARKKVHALIPELTDLLDNLPER